MAKKILKAGAGKSKEGSRRSFLMSISAALAVAAVPAVAIAAPAGAPRAKLDDHEIDLLREMYDEMRAAKIPNRKAAEVLAEKFELHERFA